MTRELRDKQKELLIKSKRLRTLSKSNVSYEKGRQLQEEQNETFKKWEFYKGINNAMAKGGKQ